MKFPKILVKGNRPQWGQSHFSDRHFVYIRHKPGVDWIEKDGLPDYNQIKIDNGQSCNWCMLSIPIWVRFDDKGNYKSQYAVVGYSLKSIRKTNVGTTPFPNHTADLQHKPIELNYSHCEFVLNRKLSRAERRELKLMIKNHSVIHLKPNQERTWFEKHCDLLRSLLISMRLHKAIRRFSA